MTNKTLTKLEHRMPLIYAVFFTVGVILFAAPLTRDLFFSITPITLLGLAATVFVFHHPCNIPTVLLFVFIIFASIFIEARGVATGLLFGDYEYLTTLGPKIASTPLVIGVNWLVVSYGAYALASKKIKNPFVLILAAALLMVIYDVILEWAAPIMQMWTFNGYPPLQNFVMWFLLGIFFQALLKFFNINSNNRAARALFVAQMLFFSAVAIIGELSS